MENHKYMAMALLVLALLVLVQFKGSDASDTISLTDSLGGNRTLKSKNGTFELGFFSPNGTGKWYIGIWYAQVLERTVAWVANRERPLKNKSGVLRLTHDGNLVLFDAEGISVWSANGTKKASKAVVLESGNLVMMGAENASETVWESFDYPGDVLLPGMKLWTHRPMRSWKNSYDPAPGRFSFHMDKSTQLMLYWNNSVQYWKSGVWNGQMFTELPEMTKQFLDTRSLFFSVVKSGLTEMYFTFTVNPQLHMLSRFALDKAGQIRHIYTPVNDGKWNIIWSQPSDQCAVYDGCGPYGSCDLNNLQFCSCIRGFEPVDGREPSNGCVRRTQLNCDVKNGSTDRFLQLTDRFLTDTAVSYDGQTRNGCKAACLNNCSCTAFAYSTNATNSSPTCQIWSGELLNLRNSTKGESIYIRLAASEMPKSSNSSHRGRTVAILVGVVGSLAAVLGFALTILFWRRRQRWPNGAPFASPSLTTFTYKQLQTATKKFSHRLGGGAFGSVFKGTLPDNTDVAVKQLEGSRQGEKEFRMEVSTIGTIQHVNLVRLRGFCSEGSKRLLVYDYMPNGSLNSFLFTKSRGQHKVLDWKTRFEIALGTARGLLYLHEKCRDCIIHCDIKPENILLDANFCPKVADFGLAKLVGRDFSRVLTTMRGTRGYLAPEWISGLPITPKADVYSFGMTLLEIIGGRRNVDLSVEKESRLYFPTWAATKISTEKTMEMVDERLLKDDDDGVDAEEVRRAAMVAVWCIQDDEDARPAMSVVVKLLEGLGDVKTPPVPKALQALIDQETAGDVDVILFPEEKADSDDDKHSSHSNPGPTTQTHA
eukprot:Gb_37900 [translate_table: standard]